MTVDDGASGNWESLAPWVQAQEWHAAAPDIANDVRILAREALQHRRAMDIRHFWLQVSALIMAFALAMLLGAAAWRAADNPNGGQLIASAIGSAVVSVATSLGVMASGPRRISARKKRTGS